MNLLEWRKEKDLTMAQAAEVLGITQPTISRIESGEHLPKSGTIEALIEKTEGAITAADLYTHWESSKQAAQ